MNFVTLILTALVIAVAVLLEAVRANRAFERALEARGLLEPWPGLAAGTARRDVARAFASAWRYRTADGASTLGYSRRVAQRSRLAKEWEADPELGPLGRRSQRGGTLAVLGWLLCLPLGFALLVVLDPVVGRVVPVAGVIRVPLLLAGCLGVWYLATRRG